MNKMNKKGFTLIELLVVLVIIGIILALILPNTLRAIEDANSKESQSNIRSINTAIQLCYSEQRNWAACDTAAELTTGQYMASYPVSPFGNKAYAIVDSPEGGKQVNTATHFKVFPPKTRADIIK